MALEDRLKKEIEKKELLPDSQGSFRKERSAIDNIYILNYAVHKYIKEKGGTLIAVFVDLKATFDTVCRNQLWKTVGNMKINLHMIEKIKEIYNETENIVKIKNEKSEPF